MARLQRILLVDDEPSLVKGLKLSLQQEGFLVDAAADGQEALAQARSQPPDLIILDLMLPGLDGLAVCRELRREGNIPIIMLTAKDDPVDKVVGLELGADDYLTKPFHTRELLARVRAVLRRATAVTGERLVRGRGVTLDLLARRVVARGHRVELTAKEFDLLAELLQHPGRVFSRDELLNRVWGYDFYGDARTVDVHIRRLREKIEVDSHNPALIMTSRGTGYYFAGQD